MVDGQLKNITRAEAYQLQSTVETNSRRSTLAVKEHRDVDFGECSIIETIVSVTLVKKNMERDRQKHCASSLQYTVKSWHNVFDSLFSCSYELMNLI